MFYNFLPDQFVLYGHIISDQVLPLSSKYRYPTFKEFEEFIDWAHRHQYQFVSYNQFLSSQSRKQILLTFDDGIKNIITELHPFMMKHSIPYMVFINPGLTKSNHGMDLMTNEDLLILQKDNVSIGFHTNSHQRIEDSTELDDPAFISDVTVSECTKNILTPPIAFAYPFSAPKNSARINTFLSRIGFEVIFGTGLHFEKVANYFVRLPMDNYKTLGLKKNVIIENLKISGKQHFFRGSRRFLSHVKQKFISLAK
jgi:peptidoglycan/xylan/chitin deacetylase (PgdA/CDA1 family)